MKSLGTREKLSLLWIVVMIDMIYNDIFSIMAELVQGGTPDIPGDVRTVMAVAAILTNIPIAMIFLARVLPRKANRIVNIAAAVFTVLYVVGGGSLEPHYIIIGAVEVLVSAGIAVLAWRWKET